MMVSRSLRVCVLLLTVYSLAAIGLSSILANWAGVDAKRQMFLLPQAGPLLLALATVLYFGVKGKRKLAIGAAGMLLLWCAVDIFSMSVASHVAARLTWPILLCAISYSLALQEGNIARRIAVAIGAAVVLLALTSFLSYWIQDSSTLQHLQVPLLFPAGVVATVVIVLMGAAAVSLGLSRNTEDLVASRVVAATGLAGVIATCLAWVLIVWIVSLAYDKQAALLQGRTEQAIKRTVQQRVELLERMAARWKALGRMPQQSFWKAESGTYLNDIADLDILGVLDSNLKPLLSANREGAPLALVEGQLQSAATKSWLIHALKERKAHVDSARVITGDASKYVVVGVPLEIPSQAEGLLVGLFDSEKLFSVFGSELGGMGLRVYDDDLLVFESEQSLVGPLSVLLDERPVSLDTIHASFQWKVQVFQSIAPAGLGASAAVPIWVVAVGLAGTLLLMLHLWKSLTLFQRTQALESSLERQLIQQSYRQRIIEHSLDMLCTIDREGRFIEVNPASNRMLGYPPGELQGKHFMDLVFPEDREATEAEAESIMRGRSTISFRNRYVHRDGHVVHLRWSAEWSVEEQTLYAIAHDISYLVQGEKYAEDQRKVLAQISRGHQLSDVLMGLCKMLEEQLPGGFCSVMLADENKKVLHVGAAPSLPAEYLVEIKDLEIAPDVGSCGSAAFKRQPVIVPDIRTHPNWSRLWAIARKLNFVTCWSVPILSDTGEVLGTMAVYHKQEHEPTTDEISMVATNAELAGVAIQRSRDLHKLASNEQRFRSLFEHNPDPVYSFDLEGRFLSMNAAGCALTGFNEQDFVGQHWGMLLDEDSKAEVAIRLASAFKGEPQRFSIRVQDKTQQTLTLDLSYMPIVIDGQIEGVFGLAKDLSDRERIADELRKTLDRSNRRASQLHALNRAATAAAQFTDEEALLEYLSREVRLVIGAHQSTICFKYASDLNRQINSISISEKYRNWGTSEINPRLLDVCASVLAENKSILIAQDDPSVCSQPDARDAPASGGVLPVYGLLAVPLISRNGMNLGLISLSDKFENNFDEGDLAVAQQFAAMAVAILENIRLFSEVIQAQEVLKDQLEFNNLITHTLGEGLIAVDSLGAVTYFNPASRQLLFGKREIDDGRRIDRLVPLPDFDTWSLLVGPQGELQGELELESDTLREAGYVIRRMDDGWLVHLRDVTQERQGSRALQERDHFFELSLDMFCLLDTQGNFVQVNPAFANTLRYTVDHLVGTSYLRLLPDEELPYIRQQARNVMAGGVIREIVLTVRDGTGQIKKLQASATVGEDRIIYCVARDITERYAADQEMQRLNLLLVMAGQSAGLGGWSVEADGRVNWAPELSAMLGYPPGVIPPLAESLALYHSDDYPVVVGALETLLRDGTPADLMVRIQTKDEKWLDVRVTGQAVRDDKGHVVRAVGALQDLTEWKRVQNEAARLSNRLLSTLESITDAFFMLDRNWHFSYVNHEALRVLDVQREEMLGKEIWQAFPGSYNSDLGIRYRTTMSTGEAQHFESYYEPYDAWFEVHAYPAEEGLSVYFRDITSRKVSEEALRNTMAELERSNRELQEFAFVASHDLQEPLRKIQTFSERIGDRESMLDDEGRDYLRRMSSAASRMQALIIDLLNYSRVGTRAREFSQVKMDSVVQDVIQDLEAAIAERRAQVECGNLPAVHGDASQLRQVMQNLISNAIKFCPPEKVPKICIRAEQLTADGWTLIVEDNGIGFDEKYLDKIFAPFQRLHARGNYPGTGIGLAIVKKIIERHGAEITASSQIGIGSIFKIRFRNT
ncbi:PAS domain S-box protein [Acidovorax delafieldii]|uniref:PAS domain S-box protein n=1 Tax=Acidovorax delafieldii TaxID=47920 RepID=UPI003ED0E5EA